MIAAGLHLGQFKALIVRATLAQIGLAGDAAVNLLTGTALVESELYFLRQISGPALGLWQMEPATHDDCWQNFLNAQPQLARAMCILAGRRSPTAPLLVSNLAYACAMARVKYLRAAPPLPAATDAAGLSAYHKRVYNTARGAADPVRNTPIFQQAIDA
ncbi:MAG: hypothetical protein LKI03_00050 [Acetobacter indonesiensis]|jgi:hypothetical protein|nr:hypothetical protein [Acetobacter indonesiensis]MCI1545331.1 hypothetical protein [Acetobacter indonesiensis]MCI1764425.1 hypothetical protein [Acetobacter indonesiensis]